MIHGAHKWKRNIPPMVGSQRTSVIFCSVWSHAAQAYTLLTKILAGHIENKHGCLNSYAYMTGEIPIIRTYDRTRRCILALVTNLVLFWVFVVKILHQCENSETIISC